MPRIPTLTIAEKTEWFKDHLPYKLTMLLSHRKRCARGDAIIGGNRDFAVCAYESGQIAARFFLEFLGLGIKENPLQLVAQRRYSKPSDVKVVDLGGKFVDPATLDKDQRLLLAQVFNAGSKATAHLTHDSGHGFDWNDFPQAIDLVGQLLETHLYIAAHQQVVHYVP